MSAEDFAAHYERKYRPTVAFLRRKGCREPEEFAQAAWVKAWEKREQCRNADGFSCWVFSIAWNMLRSSLRQPSLAIFTESHYQSDLHTRLDSEKVLKLCKRSDAALLRRRFFDEVVGGNTSRTRFRRALLSARKVVHEKMAS